MYGRYCMTTRSRPRERLEVRLDPDTSRMLRVLEEQFGQRPSDVTRRGIRLAYDEATRERRMEAARRLGSMEIEDVPDPDELARQMNEERYQPLDPDPFAEPPNEPTEENNANR